MLVVSLSAVKAINRRIYEEFTDHNYAVKIIVPTFIRDSTGKMIECEPAINDKCNILKTRLYFNNPRFQYYNGMIKEYFRYKPDVLYLENDPHCVITFIFVILSLIHHTEISCFTHENYLRSFSYSFKHFGIRGIINSFFIYKLKLFVRRSIKTVFVESNDSLKIFSAWNYKNVVKVPLGIDNNIFKVKKEVRKRIREELGLKEITIGYFGRIAPEKGVHIILNALNKIKNIEWEFVINEFEVINEYGKKIVSMLKEYELATRTKIIKTTHESIADYMNATDIVVLHSNKINNWKEQYGRVAAEAMVCGNVVLVSDNGTLPELVDNDELVIKQYDEEGLAEKLKQLINNHGFRENLKKTSITRATQYLSLDRQVELTINNL